MGIQMCIFLICAVLRKFVTCHILICLLFVTCHVGDVQIRAQGECSACACMCACACVFASARCKQAGGAKYAIDFMSHAWLPARRLTWARPTIIVCTGQGPGKPEPCQPGGPLHRWRESIDCWYNIVVAVSGAGLVYYIHSTTLLWV